MSRLRCNALRYSPEMKAHRESILTPRRGVVRDTKACYPDWAAVYADNAIWVYRMIFNRVGNQPDAEDLTTEVFLAALRPLRLSATVAGCVGICAPPRAAFFPRTGARPGTAKPHRSTMSGTCRTTPSRPSAASLND